MSETNDHDLVFLGFGTNLRPKWCPPPWGWLKWRWLAPRWAVYEKLCGFPSVRPLGCWYAPNLSTEGKISRAAKIANSGIDLKIHLLPHCSKSSFFVQKFNFDFPRKIVDFFGVKNSWKCCGFGLFSCWQLWFHEKNCQKKLGEKLVKMLRFWTF